jgi:hypothetical protein
MDKGNNSGWYEGDEDEEELEEIALKEYDITASPNDFNVKTGSVGSVTFFAETRSFGSLVL